MINWSHIATYIYDRELKPKVYIKRELGLEVNPNSSKSPEDTASAIQFLSVNYGFDILALRYVGQVSPTVHHYELFVRAEQ